ncbi:MAG: AAA family ATPase [Merismopediaceae bacterium]|nr:AAA family ATPase [Merismopediaceae bacterium]
MPDRYPNYPGISGNQTPLLSNPLLQAPQTANFIEEDEEEIDLRQLGQLIRRRALPMLVVGLAVSGLVGWRLFQQPPVYKESFQLLVQPPNTDALSNPMLGQLSNLSQLAGGFNRDISYYETQIQILTSNKLLQPIVDKLKQQKAFFKDEEDRQGFNVDDFLKRLQVTQGKDTQILEVSYKSQFPEEVKLVLDQLAATYLKYTVEDQNRQSEQKIFFLDKQINLVKQRILILQKQLEQFRLKNSFIDPENQGEVIADGLKDLNKAKQANDAQLRDAVALYTNLRQQLGISESQAIALNALTESPRYMSLLGKLREVDAKLASESTRYTDDSPIIQQLKAERENLLPLMRQEAKVALNGLPANVEQVMDGFVSPNTIRQTLIQQLLAAANQVKQAQARQQSLILSEQQTQQQIQAFARSAGSYAELAKQLEFENQSLASLLTARQVLQIEAAKSFSPWRLVSTIKTPEKPESQLLRNVLLAILAGAVAGGAAGLLLENLDRTVHSPDELAEKTGLTILGTIPLLPELSQVKKFQKQQKSLAELWRKRPEGWMSFLESYSFLYTNLFFAGEKRTLRSMVVSSATPGEGKSTVSFFLAQAAAELGRKVLLVDGDRYFPQFEYWQALATLSQQQRKRNPAATYPLSENANFPESLKAEGIEGYSMGPNLYIVKYQDMNPSQMLGANDLFEVMSDWKNDFELIIIDAPPVLGLSDTKLITNQADGLLFVARMGKANQDLVKETLLELKISGLKVIGAVANASSNLNRRNYYYYNYYYQKAQKTMRSQQDSLVP